jgi:hypothetical protein
MLRCCEMDFILDVCTGGPLSPFISCKMRLWHAWQSCLPISGEFQMNMIADLLPTIDVDTAAARMEREGDLSIGW